jgi:hypothetical protein
VEVSVLTVANLAATALRFAAMRWWIFRQSSVAGDGAGDRPDVAALGR